MADDMAIGANDARDDGGLTILFVYRAPSLHAGVFGRMSAAMTGGRRSLGQPAGRAAENRRSSIGALRLASEARKTRAARPVMAKPSLSHHGS